MLWRSIRLRMTHQHDTLHVYLTEIISEVSGGAYDTPLTCFSFIMSVRLELHVSRSFNCPHPFPLQ